MGLHEIDSLLLDSIALVRRASGDRDEANRWAFNLEQLPERLGLDAGGFAKTAAEAPPIDSAELACIVVELASESEPVLVYDWCAFVLNYWSFFSVEQPALVLARLRRTYRSHDFSGHSPRHRSLTMYPAGSHWFDDEHNAVISKFFSME